MAFTSRIAASTEIRVTRERRGNSQEDDALHHLPKFAFSLHPSRELPITWSMRDMNQNALVAFQHRMFDKSLCIGMSFFPNHFARGYGC
jgi:hypothetical protein